MGLLEAKSIYKQVETIIKTQVYLGTEKGQFHRGKGKIDFEIQLDALRAACQKIEELTFDLLTRNQRNPSLAAWVVDLYILCEYYIEEIWQLNKERPKKSSRGVHLKYYYFLKCHHYLYKYKNFLRKNIYNQNFINEHVIQQHQFPLPKGQGVILKETPVAAMPTHKNGKKLKLIAKKDKITKVSIPKAMAIIEELDLRNHPKMKKLPHQKQIEVYQMLFGGSFRFVEGNHGVLDDFSSENRSRHTSWKHKDWAKKIFEFIS